MEFTIFGIAVVLIFVGTGFALGFIAGSIREGMRRK